MGQWRRVLKLPLDSSEHLTIRRYQEVGAAGGEINESSFRIREETSAVQINATTHPRYSPSINLGCPQEANDLSGRTTRKNPINHREQLSSGSSSAAVAALE